MIEYGEILIIGDSITDGHGATGWKTNHTRSEKHGSSVIFDNGEERYYESPKNCKGWVYYLKDELKNYSPNDITVKNAAICGKSYAWGNKNKKFWIDKHYDTIIVMLGTNDRTCNDLETFSKDCEQFLSYASSKTDNLVVIIPVPVVEASTKTSGISITTIQEQIIAICEKYNYHHINLQKKVNHFFYYSNAYLSEFFSDGYHLTNYGSYVIFKMISDDILLPSMDTALHSASLNSDKLGIVEATRIDAEDNGTPVFPIGASYSWIRDDNDFVNGSGGTLLTLRNSDGVSGKQILKSFKTHKVFCRYALCGQWGKWQRISNARWAQIVLLSIWQNLCTGKKKLALVAAVSFALGILLSLIMLKY